VPGAAAYRSRPGAAVIAESVGVRPEHTNQKLCESIRTTSQNAGPTGPDQRTTDNMCSVQRAPGPCRIMFANSGNVGGGDRAVFEAVDASQNTTNV